MHHKGRRLDGNIRSTQQVEPWKVCSMPSSVKRWGKIPKNTHAFDASIDTERERERETERDTHTKRERTHRERDRETESRSPPALSIKTSRRVYVFNTCFAALWTWRTAHPHTRRTQLTLMCRVSSHQPAQTTHFVQKHQSHRANDTPAGTREGRSEAYKHA